MDTDKDVDAADGGPESADNAISDSPASDAMSDKDVRSEILQKIVAETRPAGLTKRWRFFPRIQDVRTLCGQPDDLARSLTASFAEDNLLATGVLIRGRDKQVRLSPVLGDSTSKFQVLTDSDRNAIDIVSSRGTMSNGDPPFLRYARARHAEGVQQYVQPILVASNDDDLQVLKQLNWYCTPAAGLANLDGEHVRELFTGSAADDRHRKFSFILVGWQLAGLIHQPSVQMHRVLTHLWRVNQIYDFDLAPSFTVWWPTADEFDRIKNARNFADRKIISTVLTASLQKSCRPVIDFCNYRFSNGTDLHTARIELLRAIGRSRDMPRRLEVTNALNRYGRLLDKKIVERFFQAADEAAHPAESALLIVAGQIMQHHQETDGLVRAAEMVINGDYPTNAGVLSEEALAELLDRADFLMKLRRELAQSN